MHLHAVAGDLRALPLAPATRRRGAVHRRPAAPGRSGSTATRALADLVRPGGRILVVEPDHEARYWFSGAGAGERAFATARDTLGWLATRVRARRPARLGVHVVAWLRDAGLEPLSVEAVPVSESRLGAPPPGVWEARERLLVAAADAPGRAAAGAGAARGRRRIPRRSRRPGAGVRRGAARPAHRHAGAATAIANSANAGMPNTGMSKSGGGLAPFRHQHQALGIRH